jgi:hypothetical protein
MKRISRFEIMMVARARQAFTKNRIDPDDKILAIPCSTTWVCPTDASPLRWRTQFSYEPVRKWYRKIGSSLPEPRQIPEACYSSGRETKLKKDYRQTGCSYGSTIDVQRYEVLALKATGGEGRSSKLSSSSSRRSNIALGTDQSSSSSTTDRLCKTSSKV